MSTPTPTPTTTTEDEAAKHFTLDPEHPSVYHRKCKTRFFGVKTLNSGKIAMDFKNIADEVLAHLCADVNTNLTVPFGIEATDATGIDESKVRTVSENAKTLKFDQSGFDNAEPGAGPVPRARSRRALIDDFRQLTWEHS